MALGQVRRLLGAYLNSDSEYEWLLIVQTPLSYKLNPIALGTSNRQNGIVAEVIWVTKQLRTVEKTGSLDDLLLNVVDETLRQVFKEAGTKVVYSFLENNSHLKLEEIAEKPEVFSAGLERLMVSAAQVIKNLILKKLYSKLGLKFEEKEGYGFADYVKELKEKV